MAEKAKILDRVHVYVLDDDEAVRDSIASILAMHGAIVETFGSLGETREAKFDGKPGILLFDICLEDGFGHEFLVELRHRGVSLPAILMTGRFDSMTIEPIRQICDIIAEKPIDGDDLAMQIAAAVMNG